IDLSTYELAVANFSFTDKDQVQKINFQPFRLLDSTNNLLNSIKLNIAQKKSISTFGFGFGGDYSDPFSKRGIRILDEVFNSQPSAPLPILPDTSMYAKIRDSISRTNNNDVMKKILILTLVELPAAKVVEKAKQDNDKQNQEFKKNTLDDLLLKYDERRAKHIFKWTVGFNTQYFSIFSANGSANNFDSLNYYGNKANVYSASLSYSYDRGDMNVSGGYNYLDSRKSAVKGIDKIKYNGFSLFGSKRLISFLNDEKLRKNENYKKSLFIPSLLIGGSWELKTTNEDNLNLIEDGMKRSRVLTIFTDILISPTAQFRIGLPIQKNTLVNGDKMSYLGATVQYALKFSNLN
ncbi:MAG: hypothetical protein H0U27_10560, partial [Nitrosopumilus sp.]|nr:hypothetical protein [Nitrosopumilus sp.]